MNTLAIEEFVLRNMNNGSQDKTQNSLAAFQGYQDLNFQFSLIHMQAWL